MSGTGSLPAIFTGQWYEDSDRLEEFLHFRSQSMDDFLAELKGSLGSQALVVKLLPKALIKKKNLQTARTHNGTVHWLEKRIMPRIAAFYGSMEAQQAIGSFRDYEYQRPSDVPMRLDHGYDERKPTAELAISDMRQAAAWRGGKCLSEHMTPGDMCTPLKWQCALGHTFWGSPELILKAGHWCPECTPAPWDYTKQAEVNPFFRQVWEPIWGNQPIGPL